MTLLLQSTLKFIQLFFNKHQLKGKKNTINIFFAERPTESGFSLIELIIVLLIIMIMTTVAIFPLIGHRNAYRTEDQALRIMNFIQNAKMRALSKRRPTRLEIDLTKKVLRIIDENKLDLGASDDVVISEESFVEYVRLDRQPANLPRISPNVSIDGGTLNYQTAVYITSSHPLSLGNKVWTARFLSDGTVTDAGGSCSSSCLTPISSTIFIWQEQLGTDNAAPLNLVRAITLYGGSGQARLWQYNGAKFVE
jgi:type II secretory pathway pseudopilin PulG